jgi:hypothetical protein
MIRGATSHRDRAARAAVRSGRCRRKRFAGPDGGIADARGWRPGFADRNQDQPHHKRCRQLRYGAMHPASRRGRSACENPAAPREPLSMVTRQQTALSLQARWREFAAKKCWSDPTAISNIELVFAQYEPSLRRSRTDIENCGAATRARNTPDSAQNSGNRPPETARHRSNPRMCPAFSYGPPIWHKDRTGWLGRLDSNQGMAESKSDRLASANNGHSGNERVLPCKSVNGLGSVPEQDRQLVAGGVTRGHDPELRWWELARERRVRHDAASRPRLCSYRISFGGAAFTRWASEGWWAREKWHNRAQQ